MINIRDGVSDDDGAFILFEVQDTGVGIAEDKLPLKAGLAPTAPAVANAQQGDMRQMPWLFWAVDDVNINHMLLRQMLRLDTQRLLVGGKHPPIAPV